MGRLVAAVALVAAFVAVGCGSDPARLPLGGQCELNSECDTPLVCRLERCRKECATSRDCAAGLSCVLDGQGFGACQLEEETHCALQTDCPSPLVCRDTRCVNPCAEEGSPRDCPPGAFCQRDDDGELGCMERTDTPCVYDSDCLGAAPGDGPRWRCIDGRCRRECNFERDCRLGTQCCSGMCLPECPDGIDGGLPDGGTADGGGSGTDGGTGPALGSVVAIAAGHDHGCAIATVAGTRQLFCWGRNDVGQLGRGAASIEPQPIPAAVTLPSEPVAVAASGAHTCAVLDDGRAFCWGDNDRGQLGTGTTSAMEASPVQVTGVTEADGVDAGEYHTCVTQSATGGEVLCWGGNDQNQLGDFTSTDSPTPIEFFPSGALPFAVATGGYHTCVLQGSGSMECLGSDEWGQLGGGAGGPAIADATQITGGWYFTCLLRSGGDVYC